MTRQSDHIIPVKVNIRLDPTSTLEGQLDGKQFMCCAAEDGTLADLRVVLVQDKVLDDDGGTIFVFDGRVVGKTSESHIKWSSLLKNEEIVLSRMSTSLLRKSKLGKGIIISGDNGPQYAGHAVIADGDFVAASLLDTQETCDETIHSYSTIAAEFAQAGWSKSAMASVSSSMVVDSRSLPHSNVWITGRQLHSTCQMTLPTPRALQPHPELKAAVQEALEEEDIIRRRQRLDMVWERHGTFYVDSVEMGGMCHATRMLDVSQKNTGESEMRRMLVMQFGSDSEVPGERDAGEKHTGIPANSNGMFSRVGGRQDESYSRWRASLAQPANWSTIRILQVVPVIELFDADVQSKIVSLYPTPAIDGRNLPTSSEPGPASMSDDPAKSSEPQFMAYDDDKSGEDSTASPSHSSSVLDSVISSPQVSSDEPVVPMETLASPEAPINTKSTTTEELHDTKSTTTEELHDMAPEYDVNALLNKLTAEQFDPISDQIIAWVNESKERKDGCSLKQVSRIVFEKATNGVNSSDICARLCHKMIQRITVTVMVQDDDVRNAKAELVLGGQLFRRYLIGRCQVYDEGVRSPDQHLAAPMARRRFLKFVGGLFKVHIVTKGFMQGLIKTVLDNIEKKYYGEYTIESLLQLLTAVGALLDSGKTRSDMNVFFSQMEQLRDDHTISYRIRSMTQDVIELRERKWIPHS